MASPFRARGIRGRSHGVWAVLWRSLAAPVFAFIGFPSDAGAVQPISGVQVTFDSVADSSMDYTSPGGGSTGFPASTNYLHTFNVGTFNNMIITSFDVGTNNFIFRQLSQQISIVRVDNVNATGTHHIILYDKAEPVSGTNIQLRSSRVTTMEETLLSDIINRGADNVFANTGDGNGNLNNIERIDFIFGNPQPAFGDLAGRGFLVLDRGGNDAFQVAAIMGVDGNNSPTSFSDSARVAQTNWGFTGLQLNTIVYRGYDGELRPSADIAPQELAGIFVAWDALNIAPGQLVYGYSLVANDVPTNINWLDVDQFPLDTDTTSAGGGLDLMSGGALVLDEVRNAIIGDFVWHDINMNGLQDPGEPGVPGVEIRVYDAGTNLAGLVTSDSNGWWNVFALPTGLYFMEVTAPSDWSFSPKMVGPDASVYSVIDADTGRSDLFFLDVSETNFNKDVGIYLPPTDLAVAKTVSDANPTVGDTISFSISVTNRGPENSVSVQVTDLIPAGLTFSEAVASQGSYAASNGLWIVGDLPVGAHADLNLSVTVDAGTGGVTITNRADVTSPFRPDTNTVNNADTAILVVQSADLGIAKSVNNGSPAEGDTVLFTVSVTNFGPSAATSVTLADALPIGLSFSNAIPSQGSYDSGSGIWTVGTLSSNATASVQIEARVDSGTGGTSLTNTALLTGADQEDLNDGNNAASAVITVIGADLAVNKSVNKNAPNENDEVVYSIVVSNQGPYPAGDIEVSEPLANGLAYLSHAVSQGTYDTNSGIWSVGVLDVLELATLTVTARVEAGTVDLSITNRSVITASDVPDPDTGNNSDTAVIHVSSLFVRKTSSAAGLLRPGDTNTYTVVVSNLTDTTHTGVWVYDSLPDGVIYVTGSASVAVQPPSGGGPGTGGAITNVTENGTNYFIHTFTQVGTNAFEPPEGVDEVEVLVVGGGGGGGTARGFGNAGAGGGGAGGLVHDSNLPVTGRVTVVVGAGGPGGPGTGNTNGLNGGASRFGDVVALGGGGGAGGNVSGNSGGSGGGSRGNSGGAATQPGSASGGFGFRGGHHAASPAGAAATGGGGAGQAGADLAGTAGENGGVGGDGLAYGITGSNTYYAGGGGGGSAQSGPGSPGAGGAGGGGAGGRTDIAPTSGSANTGGGGGGGNNAVNGAAGGSGIVIVRYAEAPALTGTIDDPPDLATGFTLEPGQTLTAVFSVTVTNPISLTAITNTVFVTSDQQVAPITDSVIDHLHHADLALTKAAAPAETAAGSNVVYEITVTNPGPADVSGVEVAEPMAEGLIYVEHTASQGAYATNSGVWSVGILSSGSVATLTITAMIETDRSGSVITNRSEITAANASDPDTSNNADTALVIVTGSDVGVTKTVDNAEPFAGFQITFTITAANSGPSDAVSVEISDELPDGLAFVSASASAGVYDESGGVWTIGALPADGVATLALTAQVASNAVGQVITNTASVTSVDPADPNDANDVSEAIVTPLDPIELQIAKASSADETVLPLDVMIYTITVTNPSSFAHADVVIQDPVPTGVTYVASSSQVQIERFTTNNLLDRFSSRLYSNNDGNLTWTSSWDENESPQSPTAGRVQVAFDPSRGATYSLMFQGGDAMRFIRRTADLSGYSNATLHLEYRRMNLSAGGYVAVEVSSGGFAGPWSELARYEGAGGDGGYIAVQYDISAWMSSDTAVRFITTNTTMTADEIVWFDDVEIRASRTELITEPGGIPPAPVEGYTLDPGAYLILTFQAVVETAPEVNDIVNTATATSDRQIVPVQASVTNRVESADLGVSKTVSETIPDEGMEFEYVISVTNLGPFAASGVAVEDILPPGLTLVDADASQGGYSTASGIWNVGAVSDAGGASLVLTVASDSGVGGLFLTNTARIVGMDQVDRNENNNSESVVIRVVPIFGISNVRWDDINQRAEIHHIATNGAVFDLLYVDAPSFSASLSNQWGLAVRTNTQVMIDQGGDNRVSPQSLPNGTIRFYRISAPGFWESSPRLASSDVAGLGSVRLHPGQNWIAMPFVAVSNNVQTVLRRSLPSGSSPGVSTRISWYERIAMELVDSQVWLATGATNEWLYSYPAELAGEEADGKSVPSQDAVIVEMPSPNPMVHYLVGRLPTNALGQTIRGGDSYNLVSFRLPMRLHPSQMNLVESGFTGGTTFRRSDRLWKFNRENQSVEEILWFNTGDGTWRRRTGQGDILVPPDYFSSNDGIILFTTQSGADWIWELHPPYPTPTRFMSP